MFKHKKADMPQNAEMDSSKKGNIALFKRIASTIGWILVFYLLTYVTIPGVNQQALLKASKNSSLQMLSMFSGGGFQTFSIVSMGVTSYITAQIVVQLLQSDVIPILTAWSKEGQTGRQKLTQLTRVLTAIFAFAQSIGITAGINSLSDTNFLLDNSIFSYIVIGVIMTCGTFISVWIGDQITDSGLGNGISVLIAAGIIAKLPDNFGNFFSIIVTAKYINWPIIWGVFTILILLTWLIVWFYHAEFQVRIQYSRREALTTKDSYLPLKLAVPGVVPVIFASSILTIPQTILSFFSNQSNTTWYRVLNTFFTLNTPTGMVLYAVLIVTFTYLYSFVQIEPEKMADNLQKQEAYIPGIIPGMPTVQYVKNLLNLLSLPGSIFLGVISILPMMLTNIFIPDLQLGLTGSSLLILIGVLNDISRQIAGLQLKTEYFGFLREGYSFSN